jgi:two-component system sensor histidine kinase HydH
MLAVAALAGGACLLVIGMGLHAAVTHDRTEAAMQALLVGKGTALLSSLESGLRSGRRGGGAVSLPGFLLEEASYIQGVRFAAIAGPDGFILAHSDPDRLGEVLRFADREMTAADMDGLAPDARVRWLLTNMEGEEVFVLYRRIGRMPLFGAQARSREGDSSAVPLTLMLGLDPEPLFLAREEDAGRIRVLAIGGAVCAALALLVVYLFLRAGSFRQSQKKAEALTQRMLATLPDGLILFDALGRISHINANACRWLGCAAPPLGRRMEEALPGELATLAARLLAQPLLPETSVVLPAETGPLPLSVSGAPVETGEDGRIGSLLVLRDLSERRRLEEELRRREKLAAVGHLAAGVAHEIRNPLSSIQGYATYFAGRFSEGSEERKAARVMVGEVERLNRVITDLLELARPSGLVRRPTHIAALIEDVLRLIRRDAAGQGVRTRLEIARPNPDLPLPVLDADPDRLRQAMLNLCLNALEAMPHGGLLEIRLTPVEKGVEIAVGDTGSGIAAEALPMVFDPYFTTKGQGTGLGLAIVHKVVEAHGGGVRVESRPGRGTTFTLLLPG